MRLEVLSDQGDTLRMSLIHTFLLTAYLYTTFVMVSKIKLFDDVERLCLASKAS